MDLSGCHFTYADKNSRTFGLIFAKCDTSDYMPVNGKTKTNTMFNSRDKRAYYISDSFKDSPVSFDVEFFPDDDRLLSVYERHEIEKWLFNRSRFYKLFIDIIDDCGAESYDIIDGDEKRYYFNCRFINPSKVYGSGGLAGFRATMECDSMMLWQEPVTKIFSSSEIGSGVTVVSGTEMDEYIYPKVTITMGSGGGDITITNHTDSSTRITSFSGLTGGTELMMNGNINYISGNNYIKFLDKNFIRMIPGENIFTFTGDIAQIKFEFENRKYM